MNFAVKASVFVIWTLTLLFLLFSIMWAIVPLSLSASSVKISHRALDMIGIRQQWTMFAGGEFSPAINANIKVFREKKLLLTLPIKNRPSFLLTTTSRMHKSLSDGLSNPVLWFRFARYICSNYAQPNDTIVLNWTNLTSLKNMCDPAHSGNERSAYRTYLREHRCK